MMQKLTKLTTRVLATLFAVFATSSAWAVENPVTGETETYSNTFTGETAEWDSADHWDTGVRPFISGGSYSSALVSGKTASTATSIDGWNLQVGAYNGAAITWSTLGKIQGDTGMWLTVDGTSSITINGWGGGNLGQNGKTLSYYVANANGVTWTADLSSGTDQGLTMNYYSTGLGSVSYQALGQATHVIMQADAELSGTSQVASKTLVSFTSCNKIFTASAGIKVKDGSTVLETVGVTSIRQSNANIAGTTSALTTSDAVGSCEIVQCTDGIVLYWVDGDPNALTPTVYKPSININFTNGAGNGLTTSADVGLDGYAVPGTSWNNFVVANNTTFNTVNAIDSTGAVSVASGVSVSISGTRGHWNCSNLTPASNPLHGYIDESAGGPTPTVTITGIPYEHYRVIVYHSTDQDGAQFGYDTINGFNFTYVDGVQTEGTTSWGSAGASNSAEPIGEGTNTLVSAVLSGDTVTMVAHRIGGDDPSARGCFAAIQVVEYVPEVGENDLEIAVDGATNYAVDTAKTLSGTVYLTGSGTLTLTGSEKITAATIDVAKDVVLNINADRLDATTFTGAGTVVYDGAYPVSGKGWAAIGWSGTVWVKNISNLTGSSFVMNDYGNNSSTLKVSMLKGWVNTATTDTDIAPALELDGDCEYALWLSNGNGYNSNNGQRTQLRELKGSGLLKGSDSGPQALLLVKKWDDFSGSFELKNKVVVFGSSLPTVATISGGGYVVVNSGSSVEIATGKTWSVNNGFIVNGSLTATGSMAATTDSSSVSFVKGSGTVVFNGKMPSPTGDAWWKNASWTGTVQIASVTDLVGGTSWTGSNFLPNDYGNSESVLELKNCSGWLPNDSNYQCTVPLKVTGTLTINNGISGNKFVISKLLGNGAIYTTSNGATVTIQVLNADDFTGYVQLNSKRVVFGETIPETFTSGQIYIGSGFSLTVPNSNVAWYGTGGITVDGELKAAALSNFGGGTTITTTDNGVFTLTSTGNGSIDEYSTSYARIAGTGSLKYQGSGWRALSQTDLSTALTIINEQAGDILLHTAATYNIGSLAGSKNFQGNYGSGSRYLNILQSKDTVWSGKVTDDGSSRLAGFSIDAASTGTLTLSGTATQSVALNVNGGAVNLTGTWKGATTVAGTFGGTGTLTGNLTFSDGATFKANTSALTVTGTVTLPTGAGETLTIDATGLDADEVTILSSSSITTETDVSKVTVANGLYNVTPVAGALKLVSSKVEITVPAIANTTVTVSVGGETIGTASGTYKVAPDAVVTVTYAAASGYEISGTTVYTIDVANSETTFDPTGTTQVAQYVAQIVGGSSYTTLQAAFDAVENNNRIVLLASTEDGATIPSRAMLFYFYAGNFECGTIADATGDFVTTKSDEEIEIDEVEVTAKKYRVTAAVAVVTIPNVGRTNYGDHMTAYNAFIAGPADTTMRIIGTDPFSGNITCATYDSETQTYTKLVTVASITTGVFTYEYPSLAEAVYAATAGQTVNLLANIALDTTVAIPKTLTLNLNGYEITASGIDAITSSGALTIQGSSGSVSVTSGSSVVLTDAAATLTVSGGVTVLTVERGIAGYSVTRSTDGSGNTVYSLTKRGTIFSVY